MEQTKHPLKSKTIWALILMLLVGVLTATGAISGSQAEVIKNIGPEVLSGLTTSVLALIAAWGRITAKTTLSTEQ